MHPKSKKKHRILSNSVLFYGPSVEIRTRGLLNPIREVIPKSSAIYTNHAKVAVFTGPYIGAILSIFHKMLIFSHSKYAAKQDGINES